MADIFERLKISNGKLDAKEIIHEQISDVLSGLYIYKEMLGDRETEKTVIESIRNQLCRIRSGVDDFLKT